MTIRRRPRPASRRSVEPWRGSIATAEDLTNTLNGAKSRGFLGVFLVRRKDLLDLGIRQQISPAIKGLVVQMEDASLLPVALDWLREVGGVEIWASHYGAMEKLG
ncbi:hypothetical protein [Vulcanococcus sp.]|uniref:hypothetical protein n=1 Tax=Vulcanococcus sp. TaxID=2856995 RepID=UPI003C12990A